MESATESAIHRADTALTFAHKISNLYKLKKSNARKCYKKASNNIHNKINTDGKKLMKDKDAINRMLTNGKNERFITLKDRKPNFKNNPKVRLINPAKNEIGRDSINILDKINHVLLDSLRINQWKHKHEVIEWLLKIPDKSKYKFKNISGPELERMKTNFQSLFIKYGLIECNRKEVDYLDVTFNLKDGT